MLWRREFLETYQEGEDQRIAGFVKTDSWPPPADFFRGKPIGVAYYVARWFRFALQDWVHQRMAEVESKEVVYSLEAYQQFQAERGGPSDVEECALHVPDTNGDYKDYDGNTVAAVNGHLEFDCDRYLRMLCRRGFTPIIRHRALKALPARLP